MSSFWQYNIKEVLQCKSIKDKYNIDQQNVLETKLNKKINKTDIFIIVIIISCTVIWLPPWPLSWSFIFLLQARLQIKLLNSMFFICLFKSSEYDNVMIRFSSYIRKIYSSDCHSQSSLPLTTLVIWSLSFGYARGAVCQASSGTKAMDTRCSVEVLLCTTLS